MGRLTEVEFKAVKEYVELRYSHWTKEERKEHQKKIVRAMKKALPSRRLKYVNDVEACLKRSGVL